MICSLLIFTIFQYINNQDVWMFTLCHSNNLTTILFSNVFVIQVVWFEFGGKTWWYFPQNVQPFQGLTYDFHYRLDPTHLPHMIFFWLFGGYVFGVVSIKMTCSGNNILPTINCLFFFFNVKYMNMFGTLTFPCVLSYYIISTIKTRTQRFPKDMNKTWWKGMPISKSKQKNTKTKDKNTKCARHRFK